MHIEGMRTSAHTISGTGPMRILIADDSVEINRRLRRLLLDLPCVSSVVIACTHDAAITGLIEMQPDLLILDHHFPEGKGIEILQRLGSLRENMRVIVFSAYADTLEVNVYRDSGVHAVLDKSRDLDTLLDIVTQLHTSKMKASSPGDEGMPL
jgi:response regulator of citrate/malate metabolism